MGKKKIFIAAVMCLLVISVSVQGSNDIRKAKESDKNSDNGIVEKNITINYEKEFCNGIDGIDEPYKSNGITLFTISGTWIQENNGKWWYRHDDGTYTCNQVIAKQAQDMSQNSAETWDFRILGIAKN